MADELKQEETEVQVQPDAVLAMSDEELANLNSPAEATEAVQAASEAAAAAAETDTTTAAETDDKPAAGEGDAATAAEAPAEAAGGEAEPEAKPGEGEDKNKKPEAKADATDSAADKSTDKVEGEPKETSGEPEIVDYEAAYKKIMAPFKANGKTIEPRSMDEVVKLMQMGANYTRKLQELQPTRKIVTMLSNNGLLDEGKLSFLIDLDKKDPEAIKKLIKDAGMDVLDIDTSVDPAYKPGGHAVTDTEVNFRTATEELVSLEGGRETISEIHDKWDEPSKEALWEDPSVLAVIHEQRGNGVYAAITAEMDRQKILGNIPPNTPFLEAYTRVGDAMAAKYAAEQAGSGGEQKPGTTEELASDGPQPIATRAAAVKPALANDDKAKAASPTRSTPKKAGVVKNPLAESDDDFLKQMSNRL